jgi:amino acid transporter
MPEAGGGYRWVREGLPRPNAFISGWMAWLAHIVAGSLYAVGFASFLDSLLKMLGLVGTEPLLGIFPFEKLMAVACVAAFTYINIKGTSETGKTGDIVTFIQLGTIGALIIAGFWSIYLRSTSKYAESSNPSAKKDTLCYCNTKNYNNGTLHNTINTINANLSPPNSFGDSKGYGFFFSRSSRSSVP